MRLLRVSPVVVILIPAPEANIATSASVADRRRMEYIRAKSISSWPPAEPSTLL
jgi:hypothetical protein